MYSLIKFSEKTMGSFITALIIGMIVFAFPKLSVDAYKFVMGCL